MIQTTRLIFTAATAVWAWSHYSFGADNPSPVALLRGVEMARTRTQAVKAAFEIHYDSPPPQVVVDGVVEMDGPRLRFEIFEGKIPSLVPGQVIIRDGDEFHGFRRAKREDLHIYDLQRATGVRGDVAFDPRILGLSDLMACDETVTDCLWYKDDIESLTVEGREEIKDVSAWRVKSVRDDGFTAQYWIEEPSFRVHRVTVAGAGIEIRIESEFATAESKSPFPHRVIVKRHAAPSGFERVYIAKRFEVGAVVSPDHFTLKSMDLPVNTPAVDYRINRIVGYWNGEALQERPVRSKGKPAAPKPPESKWGGQAWLLWANALVLLAAVIFLLWRRRRASRTP